MEIDALAVIIQTFVAAFFWAVFGFLARQPEEKFDPEKIVSTGIAAVVVAFASVAFQIEPDTGEQIFVLFFVRGGLVAYLEKALKAIWRRWLKDIFYGWMKERDS